MLLALASQHGRRKMFDEARHMQDCGGALNCRGDETAPSIDKLPQKFGNVRSRRVIGFEEFLLVRKLVRKVCEDLPEPLLMLLALQERVDKPDVQRIIQAEIVLPHSRDDFTRVVDGEKGLWCVKGPDLY